MLLGTANILTMTWFFFGPATAAGFATRLHCAIIALQIGVVVQLCRIVTRCQRLFCNLPAKRGFWTRGINILSPATSAVHVSTKPQGLLSRGIDTLVSRIISWHVIELKALSSIFFAAFQVLTIRCFFFPAAQTIIMSRIRTTYSKVWVALQALVSSWLPFVAKGSIFHVRA